MPSLRHISKGLATVALTATALLGLSACAEEELPEGFEPVTFRLHMVSAQSNFEAAMRLAYDTGRAPPGTKYFPQKSGGGLIVKRKTQIDGNCLKDVSHGIHPEGGHPILYFSFNKDCAKIFGELTSKNIGKRFAIIINDEIITAPVIRTEIAGGSGFIEGSFTVAEVKALAKQLNQTITYNKRK